MSALHQAHRTRAEAILAIATLLVTGLTVFQPVGLVLGARVAWLIVFVPATLCIIVLVGIGTDLMELYTGVSDRSEADGHRLSRLGQVGTIALLSGLAILTLWFAFGTGYVLVASSEGGVFFGPVLTLFTGNLLSILVIGRIAVPMLRSGTVVGA